MSERGVGEVEWTQKAPPVPAPLEPAKRSKLAVASSPRLKDVEARRDAGTETKKEAANPVQEEEMERDEALHDYARRVASRATPYRPGEHPEDGKDVAF